MAGTARWVPTVVVLRVERDEEDAVATHQQGADRRAGVDRRAVGEVHRRADGPDEAAGVDRVGTGAPHRVVVDVVADIGVRAVATPTSSSDTTSPSSPHGCMVPRRKSREAQ